MKLTQLLSVALSLVVLLSACVQEQASSSNTGDQDISRQNSASATTETLTITGVASKGPISAATVEIFAFDNNGQQSGAALATTTTDANGLWQVNIGSSPVSALLIVVSGGSYLDEADPAPTNKRTISFASTDTLQGVLLPGESTASVTILTHALLEKSRAETTAGNFQAVLNNNRNTARLALGFDPFSIISANPLAPAASANADSIEYAMYLGGIATALNSAAIILNQPIPDYPILRAMVDDLSDGNLNGRKRGVNVQVSVGGTLTDFPQNISLNAAIQRFRNNNFAAYAATPVQNILTVNETVLAVSGTNSSPNAVADAASTIRDVAINIANLLANDTDPDGDTLVITGFSQPSNGLVTQGENGLLRFVPASGFTGNTVFSYSVSDSRGGESSAQVVITVNAAPVVIPPTPSGSVPTAEAGTNQTVNEQTSVTLSGSGTDTDGTIASVQWTQLSGTTVVLSGATTTTASFTTPAISQVDVLIFSLTVTDNVGLIASDTVSIVVIPVNVSPSANAGIDQTADEQSSVTLTGSGTDSDGTIAAYQWSQISGTPVTLTNADTAIASFNSPVVLINTIDVLVFQLSVTDDSGAVGLDFATLIVNPVLVAPVANAGTDQTLNELQPVTLSGSATDDGSIASYAWTQTAGAPTVVLSDASIASPTFTGPDIANDTTFTFQLTVTDNEGGSATAQVNINLLSLNSGPLVVDDSGLVADEDTATVISSLLNNDTDPEADTFTINSVSSPTANGGTVTIDAGNTSVTYTSALDYNGPDSFTYTAIDQSGAVSTAAATVTITVNPLNDAPVANPDTASVVQGFPLTISNLTANDTDIDLDTLSITGVTQSPNGSAVNNGDGTVTYTPVLSFNGSDSFSYNIVDGNGGSATGTVNVTVIADSDGDGIIDSTEILDGTDPALADSDADGFFDGHEKLVGTNPNLNTNFPLTTVISTANTNNVISTNTTWSLAQSPFWLQSDVTIQSGATLTIQPGVVIKSNLNVDIFVNSGGTLNAQGNAAVPQHVVFTSALDDSINGDTNGDGVATTASDNDWAGIDFNAGSSGQVIYAAVKDAASCIGIFNSSPVIRNVEIGDCSQYGVDVQTSSSTQTTNLSSITINDYDNNGQSTGFSGIRVFSSNTATAVLNINNISMTEPGSGGQDGLQLQASGGSINGSVNLVSITNPASDGINILNTGTGTINVAFSNLAVTGAGVISLNERNLSTGVITSSYGGTNSFVNNSASNSAVFFQNTNPNFLTQGSLSIDSAGYGLSLNNSDGSFNNIAMTNTAIAGLQLSNASNPAVFSTISLTNALTPYELVGQNLTPTIIAGYDFSDVSVSKKYIRINGSLLADTTLGFDPLATGSSVWRVTSNIIVPAGIILTVTDDAVIKFDQSTILSVDGTLSVTNGAGGPAIFTSIKDDVLNDTDGVVAVPARGDWNYIQPRANSTIAIDGAIIRYMNYGLLQQSNPASVSIANSTITEFSQTGLYFDPAGSITYNLSNITISNGSFGDALFLFANTGDVISLNISGLIIDATGNGTTDRGLHLDINGDATLAGTLSNITLSNIAGSGFYLDDSSTGAVNPVISGLNINGTIGSHGVQLIGNATTIPTFNASVAPNNINAGIYNLTVQGAGGSYSNLNLSNATSASILFSDNANPLSWDDATIVLTNAPAPLHLRSGLPASVGILGTVDRGYNLTLSTITQNYIEVASTLSNSTLIADPLNTGSSVWRVPASITVPAGVTLTLTDDAILKFNAGTLLTVNGTLAVTNTGGGPAIFTSIKDDVFGDTDGVVATPARGDWQYIQAQNNSVIAIDNAIIRYMNYGILQQSNPASFTVSNSTLTEFSQVGLYLDSAGAITYNLSNNTISNGTNGDGLFVLANTGDAVTLNISGLSVNATGNGTNNRGIFLDINGNATLGGTLSNVTVSNIAGSGIYLDDTSTGNVNPVFSAISINGSIGVHGMQLIGDATTTPTINASIGANNINAGTYNLTLQGVGGSYSNLNLANAGNASLLFSNAANPLSWDDATIILTSSPSPLHLRSNLPASVGILGTADLGYNLTSSTVSQKYIEVADVLTSMTLIADPLNTLSSVWRVPANITVPAGVTLTVTDDAIVKFNANLLMLVDGSFSVTSAGGGPAIFTSIKDDVLNDTDGVVAIPARGDWGYINPRNGSNIAINNAIVRYMDYGLLQQSNPASVTVSNSIFTEFSQVGLYLDSAGTITYNLTNNTISNGTNGDGLFVFANTGDAVTLNISGLSVNATGNGTNNRGIFLDINGNSTLTGTLSNLTVSNTAGSGVYLDDTSTGLVNPVFSGLNIFNVGVHGMQLIGTGDGTTVPTINASVGANLIGNANAASGGQYGLTLQGVNGSYSNLTINNTTLSSLYFSNNASPAVFDGTTITLDNAPSPYSLIGMNLPATVTYLAGAGLVENFARISGVLVSDVTLNPNPLGANTYWYIPADLDVTTGRTLTINAATVLKFQEFFMLDVQTGGSLNVNGTAGNEVIMTSFTDNAVGVANSALTNDWEGLFFRSGSLGGTVNFLTIWYGRDGVNITNAGNGLSLNNLTVNYAGEGVVLNATTSPVNPAFNNLTINESSSANLYLLGSGAMTPTFSGNLSLTDIVGTNGTYGLRIESSANTTLSNFTVSGSTYAAYLGGSTSAILQNSIFRQAATNGVRVVSSGAPIIQNNVIVNNGGNVSDAAGIYATTSTNAFINNNLIRHNRGQWGAGIFVRSASPVIQNNLIIENTDVNANTFGGGGLMVFTSSSPTIINNTIANNVSAETTSFGAGLSLQSITGTVTLNDNIIFGNVDGNAAASDLSHDGIGTLIENFNLMGVHNLATPGLNSLPGNNPLFTSSGWYLNVLALNGGVSDSPAIDAGSDLAGNTALGSGIVILSSTTTRTDGVNEGAASQVDMGYHYPNNTVAPVVSAVNSTVVPATHVEVANAGGAKVLITLTPRNGLGQLLSAGLKVAATSTQVSNLSAVTDNGDGSYQATYTIPVGTSSDTVSFSVNGITINANTALSWSP